MTLVAQFSHLAKDREWVTTPREKPVGAEAREIRQETAEVLTEEKEPEEAAGPA